MASYTMDLPSVDQLNESASRQGLDLNREQILEYRECMKGLVDSYNATEEYPVRPPRAKYNRSKPYIPPKEENNHNAWYVKATIQGAPSGPLAGKTLAIKDNVAVADINMMCGSNILKGYVPEFDATVVQRVLDAGGTIKGKATCDDLCVSRGGFDTPLGPVLNPLDTTRVSGGSSSGCAVLIALGEVDMAIGGDQGGSVRIPASMCGIAGLKPTFGLIPYTGCVNSEQSIDHLGPMAKSVKDVALLLDIYKHFPVLAGADGLDPRQPESYNVPVYSQLLSKDVTSIKIGFLKEGFTYCEPEINSIVKDTTGKLKQLGAKIEEVSIPEHYNAEKLWKPVHFDGTMNCTIIGEGNGTGGMGFYSTSLGDHMRQKLKTNAKEISTSAKLALLWGDHVKEEYGNHFYNKSQNVRPIIRKAYDDALSVCDVLVMPTLPDIAPKQPKPGISITEYQSSVYTVPINTPHFNYTGHPALTVNAGYHNNMPVGLQIVGKFWDETTVLQVGYAIEKVLGDDNGQTT